LEHFEPSLGHKGAIPKKGGGEQAFQEFVNGLAWGPLSSGGGPAALVQGTAARTRMEIASKGGQASSIGGGGGGTGDVGRSKKDFQKFRGVG